MCTWFPIWSQYLSCKVTVYLFSFKNHIFGKESYVLVFVSFFLFTQSTNSSPMQMTGNCSKSQWTVWPKSWITLTVYDSVNLKSKSEREKAFFRQQFVKWIDKSRRLRVVRVEKQNVLNNTVASNNEWRMKSEMMMANIMQKIDFIKW